MEPGRGRPDRWKTENRTSERNGPKRQFEAERDFDKKKILWDGWMVGGGANGATKSPRSVGAVKQTSRQTSNSQKLKRVPKKQDPNFVRDKRQS